MAKKKNEAKTETEPTQPVQETVETEAKTETEPTQPVETKTEDKPNGSADTSKDDKGYNAEVIHNFNCLETKDLKLIGEKLKVSNERLKLLVDRGLVKPL